jgi:AraC-binding-like domain
MLLLDTSAYPAADRAEVIRATLGELAGSTVEPAGKDAPIQVRLRAWDAGDGCSLFRTEGSGLRVRRLSGHMSASETGAVGFSIQSSGQARFSQRDRRAVAASGGMFLAEMSQVYDYEFAGRGDAVTLQIPLEVLDVRLREVRRAAERLPLSPVYDLACQHLLALSRYTETFDVPHPAAQQAAIYVFRALVKSFSHD